MLIAEAAKAAAVNVQTLRYYERAGLLKPSGRRASGYREYSSADVRKLRFVNRAKSLGLSLKDVKELLTLSEITPRRRQAVRKIAHARLTDLTRRIDELTRMRDALKQLAHLCDCGADPHCPILEALEGSADAETPR